MSSTENVYLEYIYPEADSPFASLRYWSDPGATQPWTGMQIPYGQTVEVVIGRTTKSDDFQFEAVTLWYAGMGGGTDTRFAARTYDKPNNSDPESKKGITVSSVSVNPSGNVTFTIDNRSQLQDTATLGLQTTIRDHSSNKATKNQLFTSRDPSIDIDKPT